MIEVGRNPGKIRQAIILDILRQIGIERHEILLLHRAADYIAIKSERIVPAHILAILIAEVANLWHSLEIASPADTLFGELSDQIVDGDGSRAPVSIAVAVIA